jgi:GNAT superfamily N-acetyltransferase
MSATKDLGQQFLEGLSANTPETLEAALAETAGLRLMRWDGLEAYRPRARVIERLQGEWRAWPDARLEPLSCLAQDQRIALEFRIQATDPDSGRYVEYLRAAFLSISEGRVQTIDLYCPEPIPSAHRQGWLAPATLDDEQMARVLEKQNYSFDTRQTLPSSLAARLSVRGFNETSEVAHPGSNRVGASRWTAQAADAQIEAVIEEHRRKNIGFSWMVQPNDTPADMAQRLEAHGLVLAGSAALMVRRGLDDLETIPVNPAVTVTPADVTQDEHMQAILRIGAASFNWTPEQLPEWRQGLLDTAHNPERRETELGYLAYLDGQAVGFGRVSLRGGLALLSGAGTLPQQRGRRVYSTLLRRRLETARARGYQVATIQAEPMSRRVVVRYGFEERARTQLYAWMPVMDMDVIKGLVPDE